MHKNIIAALMLLSSPSHAGQRVIHILCQSETDCVHDNQPCAGKSQVDTTSLTFDLGNRRLIFADGRTNEITDLNGSVILFNYKDKVKAEHGSFSRVAMTGWLNTAYSNGYSFSTKFSSCRKAAPKF